MRKLFRSIFLFLRKYLKKEKAIYYKIGNTKHHNAFVDGLSPNFIEIGDYFVSAPGAYILSHDSSTFRHTGKYRIEKTIIGDRVYLGANAVILPGVKVGDGAIIGAGAVVSKNVAPYTVVAGVPAKFICTVEEYIRKCESKNCLYEPPKSFEKLLKNQRPSEIDKKKFREKTYKEALNRGKL